MKTLKDKKKFGKNKKPKNKNCKYGLQYSKEYRKYNRKMKRNILHKILFKIPMNDEEINYYNVHYYNFNFCE